MVISGYNDIRLGAFVYSSFPFVSTFTLKLRKFQVSKTTTSCSLSSSHLPECKQKGFRKHPSQIISTVQFPGSRSFQSILQVLHTKHQQKPTPLIFVCQKVLYPSGNSIYILPPKLGTFLEWVDDFTNFPCKVRYKSDIRSVEGSSQTLGNFQESKHQNRGAWACQSPSSRTCRSSGLWLHACRTSDNSHLNLGSFLGVFGLYWIDMNEP